MVVVGSSGPRIHGTLPVGCVGGHLAAAVPSLAALALALDHPWPSRMIKVVLCRRVAVDEALSYSATNLDGGL
jgi:hypothetical protein